jgi:hypothetical protein
MKFPQFISVNTSLNNSLLKSKYTEYKPQYANLKLDFPYITL